MPRHRVPFKPHFLSHPDAHIQAYLHMPSSPIPIFVEWGDGSPWWAWIPWHTLVYLSLITSIVGVDVRGIPPPSLHPESNRPVYQICTHPSSFKCLIHSFLNTQISLITVNTLVKVSWDNHETLLSSYYYISPYALFCLLSNV